jgi:hypothetical protein
MHYSAITPRFGTFIHVEGPLDLAKALAVKIKESQGNALLCRGYVLSRVHGLQPESLIVVGQTDNDSFQNVLKSPDLKRDDGIFRDAYRRISSDPERDCQQIDLSEVNNIEGLQVLQCSKPPNMEGIVQKPTQTAPMFKVYV